MKLPLQTWHNRYLEQARWTKPARRFLFDKIGLSQKKKVLEVGCGTGALLEELSYEPGFDLFGLDISDENLAFARKNNPEVLFEQANAHCLPFCPDYFDVVYTHYVLLWLNDPISALREMYRVTKPEGYVLALAEPDYGGRIDYPSELKLLGTWQAESLRIQNADPLMGRKLGDLFLKAGLDEVHSGVIGGEWHHSPSSQNDQSEWDILMSDISSLPNTPPQSEIANMRSLDIQSRKSGSRVLYVPTFFAVGKKTG